MSNWWPGGPWFDSSPVHCQVKTLGKLFTHVALSPSSIIWYWPYAGKITAVCEMWPTAHVIELCLYSPSLEIEMRTDPTDTELWESPVDYGSFAFILPTVVSYCVLQGFIAKLYVIPVMRLSCVIGDTARDIYWHCLHYLLFLRFPFFLRAKAAVLSARLSYRNSVRLSVTRVDQAKTVQARISKSSPSAAWKTLVSGTVKLFHKFEGGHPERGG